MCVVGRFLFLLSPSPTLSFHCSLLFPFPFPIVVFNGFRTFQTRPIKCERGEGHFQPTQTTIRTTISSHGKRSSRGHLIPSLLYISLWLLLLCAGLVDGWSVLRDELDWRTLSPFHSISIHAPSTPINYQIESQTACILQRNSALVSETRGWTESVTACTHSWRIRYVLMLDLREIQFAFLPLHPNLFTEAAQ